MSDNEPASRTTSGPGNREAAARFGQEPPPVFEDQAAANAAAKRRQRLALYGAVVVGGIVVAAILLGHPGTPTSSPPGQPNGTSGPHGPTAMPINTDSMTAASLADSNYRAMSENRMDSLENRLKAVQARDGKLAQLEQEMQEIRQGRAAGAPTPGQGAANPQLAARDAELAALRAQIAELKRGGGARAVGAPSPAPLPGAPVSGTGALPGALSPRPGTSVSGVKVDTYGAGSAGKQTERTSLLFADSPDYLPPNSIATARVIVGADAQAGVRSQTEPLPVVLRITSDARSVVQDNKLLKTRVQGCLVNGAAFGDLSSEKVFVKLQKMTCNGAHGGVTVSEVKGFVAFAGKAGVRGRVVSREGNLVVKAFLAGLVGGLGKLGSNVAQSQLYNSYATNGQLPKIDLTTIAAGAGGSGLSAGAGDISKYLIERAEQYQPVVEMPTGVDVEVVFLDGSYVR